MGRTRPRRSARPGRCPSAAGDDAGHPAGERTGRAAGRGRRHAAPPGRLDSCRRASIGGGGRYSHGMRSLRRQLIGLLDAEGFTPGGGPARWRLSARLLHGCWRLLASDAAVATDISTFSCGNFHRHLLIIRCPDQAFYYDAVRNYLHQRDIGLLEQQTITLNMRRDASGARRLQPAQPDAADNLMLIALHVSATLVKEVERLGRDLQAVLRAVELSVRDFDAMRRLVATAARALLSSHPDQATLLEWMLDEKYIFYGVVGDGLRLGVLGDGALMERLAPGLSGQLALTDCCDRIGVHWWQLPATHNHLYSASLVEVVQLVWREGEEEWLHRATLLGHFSRSARHFSASRTPLLKPRWQRLLAAPLLRQSAFYRRELRTLFDRVPKPMLLAVPSEQWLQPLRAIVDLADSRKVVVSRLHPEWGIVDYLMVTISSSRFGPNVTAHMRTALAGLGLRVEGINSFGVASYRVLFFACDNRAPARWPEIDEIRARLADCITFWWDRARDALLELGDRVVLPEALALLGRSSPRYRECFPPEQYAEDYLAFRRMREDRACRVRVRRDDGRLVVQILSPTELALGALVERVQAFGLVAMDEMVATLGEGEETMVVSQLGCRPEGGRRVTRDAIVRLQHALACVMNGTRDHDPLNALLISAGLDIDQIAVMITLRNYLVQIEREAAVGPLTQTMLEYPAVTRALFRLFEARHRPAMPATYGAQAQLEFDRAMGEVRSLAHDRWFRALHTLISASLRSNQWTRRPEEPVVIKIDGQRLPFGPTPRPWREIFVHGTHVEGVHLRAGPVARGGLRFSDRPADFRTEVHELMVTQTVKNGQIVPTGAKGGFVVRGGEGEPFVRAQYRVFVDGLLSVTDNLLAGEVVPPVGMVVPEEDAGDYYLVVAADKGTARYSDEANALARARHYWLDDAFASGGRHGYDHKEVGITARGAWVCAAHHFRSLGIDGYRDPITVVGIGDMSGDVFGNGMLINPAIRLIGAFNHRHIFIDPAPDPERAFAERRRLFREAGGWDRYDASAISEGGGVFLRSAKSIPVSDAMRRLFRLRGDAVSGEALIRALLAARVDLLYNGGIGTYIKAAAESHAQVRDPANNAVRIDAEQVQARVVCEGGNLGITQQARIVMAGRGILLNTDAIDNAAGVNMSDHEVNLKILLQLRWPGADGAAARNRSVARQTEAVTRICLDDNRDQAQALTLAEIEAREYPPRLIQLRDRLADEVRLDRTLSDERTLALRPQLALLLGYEKNRLHEELNRARFYADSVFADRLLAASFPAALARRLREYLPHHPLAADLVHTQAANRVINQFGITSVSHLQSMVDAPVASIVQALLIADALLDGERIRRAVWRQIGQWQRGLALLRAMQEQVLLLAEELLRIHPVMEVEERWLQRSRRGIRALFASLDRSRVELFVTSRIWHHDELVELGLEEELARRLGAWPLLARSAVAVHLAGDGWALSRLLAANHAVLSLLPMLQLEAPLRTTEWALGAAHALRCEWLQRLSAMRCHAVLTLLRHGRGGFEEIGRRLWHGHPAWPMVERRPQGEGCDEKLELLLALSRLQSVVEEAG
ncbi:MAG: NAD-glutamate dehydrogenase [Zetaproteobacteria bacterium]|nr:MAG: NAD-glutamate dehydrogenase [Zetaproteobacteria bacterium]